jgi:hypothetical protein
LDLLTNNLPERKFSEENQQVAMKRERQLLFFIHLVRKFSPIFHDYRYIFVTANLLTSTPAPNHAEDPHRGSG